ncbi:MAG: hypothetical protein A2669_00945 [Candidatus Yanofskybacteria bacterium RIFCSPHIGHO2_01_FULL_48_25b]|nr:MAG: hypothetical protein A2669_00945 [Candidatus Yanofskybacteria bacterium RIFCSPHIGHO2_01_FULL_48_25b]
MIPLAPEIEFKLFYSSFKSPAPERPYMNLPNVRVYDFRIPNNLLFFCANIWGYPCLDDMLGGVDVFFSPHFFLAPLSPAGRRITTFHDLSYLRFPEFFTWRKRLWHNVEMNPERQAKLSDKIIAVSESTRDDLVEFYNIDPQNISVVHSGVNVSKPDAESVLKFKKNKGLSERYALYVGTIEPRKNLQGLVQAFNILKERDGHQDVELIIIGKRGWRYEDIFQDIANSPYASAIRYQGHLTEDLSLYYSAASVCICPSFFEGFGFPVLEAMACGTPVIASANSSLPEVAGSAALLIDPYNISDLAEAIRIVLSDKAISARMSEEGIKRAKKFDWDTAAQKTLEILTT